MALVNEIINAENLLKICWLMLIQLYLFYILKNEHLPVNIVLIWEHGERPAALATSLFPNSFSCSVLYRQCILPILFLSLLIYPWQCVLNDILFRQLYFFLYIHISQIFKAFSWVFLLGCTICFDMLLYFCMWYMYTIFH